MEGVGGAEDCKGPLSSVDDDVATVLLAESWDRWRLAAMRPVPDRGPPSR